ncbi:DUF3445 domain-containing protein [Pseudaminobacter arsenicus]|uniref:DUF3445 domain-containing protein n=1 Tax=Borborobacter arsenicus TaxID=1851146 RepID=A0A432V5Z6_9HYPH|nr:DUF3445 domain-containing protein [Pseudaminobacter arsenicus]RUM97587.1 DUF3445 domain-containing protein [Pseudaminobacter arsenicus]
MQPLKHTPYDGSTKPFTIALKPLDPREWIELDDDLTTYLSEKDRLYATVPGKVFVAQEATVDAQRELLDLLVAHLLEHHPDTYRQEGTRIHIAGGSRSVEVDDTAAPLRVASLLVPEDLILMRRHEDGWRLDAGALCFPSSWSLEEKFGRTMQDIHIPVPAFGPGTRTASIIDRVFDNLLVEQPVQRFNWSLQAGRELYMPFSQQQRIDRATMRPSKFSAEDDIAAQAFIRVERQTLRKLPRSGDIVFTIRIYLDPLSTLARHSEATRLASSFADQLDALDQAQLDYKGLAADRDRLAAILRKMQDEA